MTKGTYPQFRTGQSLGDVSARQMQKLSDAAQKIDNLKVGPFLKVINNPTAVNISLDINALMNYIRPPSHR